jgi:aspartyl protease
MRFLVFALVVQLSMQGAARSEISSEIPFDYRDGLIWIKVRLAGEARSLNFLLDSGSSVTAVDLETAQTHGVHLGDQRQIEGVSGHAFGYSVKDFRANLGGNALPKSVIAIDLRIISGRCHQHIDGILGVDFFRSHIVRIDFHAGKISLLKNCDMNLASCEILPMKMCNGAFCVPMQIAGNPTQWVRLDTGCDSALEWVTKKEQRSVSKQDSTGRSLSSKQFVTSDVQIGKQHFTVRTALHEKPIFSSEAGLLGNGLLEKFCLTIDAPQRRVILN